LFAEALAELRGRVLVVPVASVEEHGCLPASTDYLLALCLARRMSGRRDVAVLPPVAYTLCPEHRGCIDAGDAWRAAAYLESVLSSAARISGVGVVVAVTHGGAYSLAYTVARTVTRSTGVRVVVVDVVGEAVRAAGREGCVEHAGPVEASMLAACGYGPACASPTGGEEEAVCVEGAGAAPWLWSDYGAEALYPSRVTYPRGLGEKIWDAVVGRVIEAAGLLYRGRG